MAGILEKVFLEHSALIEYWRPYPLTKTNNMVKAKIYIIYIFFLSLSLLLTTDVMNGYMSYEHILASLLYLITH